MVVFMCGIVHCAQYQNFVSIKTGWVYCNILENYPKRCFTQILFILP